MTPLMFAAQAGSEACVRRLLEAGAHPNAVDEEDLWASLHFAAKEAHLGVCGLLLEARADTRALNCDDHTALQVAQMEEAAARPGSSSRGGRAATRASGSLGEGRWALRRSLSRVERPCRRGREGSMTHLSILPIVASRPQRIEVLPTLPRNQRRRRCWGFDCTKEYPFAGVAVGAGSPAPPGRRARSESGCLRAWISPFGAPLTPGSI
ncbi:unnamed protein product [Prorocentrum cordatum]|uniref:Uncharacterized protein n=1 Tax=Prorocentrum cordatum TaxID=2364126 RepID=A0ABN9XH31_9DINO|nr:unnamed protein product [Polarella glacialis]